MIDFVFLKASMSRIKVGTFSQPDAQQCWVGPHSRACLALLASSYNRDPVPCR